ncbi:uncharacterized protein K452DRAFT_304922 [Aplosporella prunicola CBS 121167]|uniref:Uncharacterized protein n=1 Tax=Aplosporella prunicola CBS 121167 TaxID=1176127 RepID=A0A6A6BPB0_9PEZI|nr:uncharacterized protein K452DRAFT_304922 [Aplosporella prunicola CBS 121167]KAF2145906.1 hypothetical protein K452DRAFT_304922 [Aplosporella prunicola CBS 121167]
MSLSTVDSRSLKTTMTATSGPRHSRLFLYALSLVTFAFTVVTTVFTILDASSFYYWGISFGPLAIVAATFNLLSLGTIVAVFIQLIYRQGRRGNGPWSSRSCLVPLCLLPTVVAVVLTLATYILTQTHKREVLAAPNGHWSFDMPPKYTIWALSTASQAVFFVITIWNWPSEQQYAGAAAGSPEESPREATPAMASNALQTPHIHGSSLSSPTFSNSSTHSLSNWGSSFYQAVYPVTSRTKLLARGASSLRDSISLSSMRTNSVSHPPDGFAMWNSSEMDPHLRDTIMQSGPSQELTAVLGRGTRLEPIPGSRPVSPARALNGPFSESPPVDTTAMPSPAFISPHTSRPPSPNIDSAMIHPLFRPDSPVPPPAATPGTVVVASPLSGHVIPRPHSSRSRTNSRTMSPSPLTSPSQIFGDAGSIRSGRGDRCESPLARAMTPPIPEFILSESPRVSSSASSLRKHSLHGPDDSR